MCKFVHCTTAWKIKAASRDMLLTSCKTNIMLVSLEMLEPKYFQINFKINRLYRENKNYNNVAHTDLLCVASFKLQVATCNLQRLRTVYKQQKHGRYQSKRQPGLCLQPGR